VNEAGRITGLRANILRRGKEHGSEEISKRKETRLQTPTVTSQQKRMPRQREKNNLEKNQRGHERLIHREKNPIAVLNTDQQRS